MNTDALTFTEDELYNEVNRFAEIDGRVLPRVGKGGVAAKTGKCSRCGSPSGPYSTCRKHRETGTLLRALNSLADAGAIVRVTDGRGSKGGSTWRNKPKVPFVRTTEKIGRNDPCPCNSGKKYKKCCGALSRLLGGE